MDTPLVGVGLERSGVDGIRRRVGVNDSASGCGSGVDGDHSSSLDDIGDNNNILALLVVVGVLQRLGKSSSGHHGGESNDGTHFALSFW